MNSFSKISLYFGDTSLSKLSAAALEGWVPYENMYRELFVSKHDLTAPKIQTAPRQLSDYQDGGMPFGLGYGATSNHLFDTSFASDTIMLESA
jgi:hypothetical protein